ncbi:MAG: hypothetical protein HY749_08970 [Gammaproteobacteria bacterium]|nr:hypothetical protein [Gammaproteobacteria bacterium]MBI5616795.1 hypothetical protein [Gammaproteobacteria bacterium]
MVTVAYSELSAAYEFSAAGGGEESSAYLALDTGTFHYVSSYIDTEEELPDDLETSDRYLLVPGKSELGLGKRLALRFVEEQAPALLSQTQEIFRHKGAYARYKGLLESRGALERWYESEAEATKSALLQWCSEHEVEVTGA